MSKLLASIFYCWLCGNNFIAPPIHHCHKECDWFFDIHLGLCKECLKMTVRILMNEKANPPGKLADAELHFTHGPLEGMKLVGFAVWERKTGTGRNVTFPARQYSVNGERRSFALLRPIMTTDSQDRIRDIVLQAYAEHEAQASVGG